MAGTLPIAVRLNKVLLPVVPLINKESALKNIPAALFFLKI
jgi:hypothetical protein